jgi:alkanesulfonate monooxygenase SsuD/methylene tetrahydromethanopterin reductase-like flavin-dependent oxidoreductase (luciferase family)
MFHDSCQHKIVDVHQRQKGAHTYAIIAKRESDVCRQTMKIGIGLPTLLPSDQGSLMLDWARQADDGPFSSIGVIDRIVYPNFEPLTTLAAMAGATRRLRLLTNVLIAPLRSTVLLAKEIATLDALSGGRVTLGLGVGGREDDFVALSASYHDRGQRFDTQLTTLKRLWSGHPLNEEIGAIGPLPVQPGGPEIIIGGSSPAAIKRVGRWSNGYMVGTVGPESANTLYRQAEVSWQEAGRSGKPRLMACAYFGLGPGAQKRAPDTVREYYAFLGPMADFIVNGIAAGEEGVRAIIQKFEEIGTDELIMVLAIPEADQVKRLADVVSG